jgi:NAD-dependent dihydropyrimidine dehydrogenase PreA subunit
MRPDINRETCTGCRNCIAICPGDVYGMDDEKAAADRAEDCIECGACVVQCPTESIHLRTD